MHKIKHYGTILVFVLTTLVVFQGCAVFKKNGCGCPNKKGMTGY
ncbi:MAG: hypothetical protein ACK5BV_06920 [Bacteroidota bacterium]|jgi:hypothetical protein